MSALFKLPQEVHNQLRSSIVVTNLGQLVEELVCNSIDAGAQKIQVFFDPTTFRIQVLDDGHGISRDDLSVLGVGHATSKLKDLAGPESSPLTLGFRGEALSSIAQCASLTIVTKTRGAQAFRKVIKGGKCLSLELSSPSGEATKPIGIGTAVDVQDLFFNQPVKRKQLLSRSSKELEDLRERVLRLAFVHTEVVFEIINTVSQQRLLSTPRVRSPTELVECLFGFEAASGLQPVHHVADRVVLWGCITKKDSGQTVKGLQYLCILSRRILVVFDPPLELFNQVSSQS
ncbi:hypothetical protein KFL_002620095 [Klebsormidium nitens]|uniref:Uncharacterized protein n=1 Tax=Klebsormidium nitens TaxID=105231 RepID=A0A1Y1I620_KLENI|nr:hypothetical protein KFL_002620095 [Klebsormidium nitens]|eukprot:GAQ85943.1 hypothetical protein KFL_002620095 [Klebsormidium nitens]